jgi:hypothetical protein
MVAEVACYLPKFTKRSGRLFIGSLVYWYVAYNYTSMLKFGPVHCRA